MASSARVVAVAVSGGMDSTALLHACVRSAKQIGLRVLALHVNHGLQAQADEWQTHVERQCRRWARAGWPLDCLTCKLQGRPAPGQSVEAWAREHRYQSLARMAHERAARLVLLAHHRRDQAETVLLQALRGGGPAGLAAMPVSMRRHGVVWARPWLNRPHADLLAYVRRWRLSFIEDPSNSETSFDRNRLRHSVWPVLLQAFPDAEPGLFQAARQAAHAAALIEEVAGQDLLRVVDGDALRVAAWRSLSVPRRRFVLRAWLIQQGLGGGVQETLLDRLQHELSNHHHGRWPAGKGGELRLYRDALRYFGTSPPAGGASKLSQQLPPSWTREDVDLSEPGDHPLPAWRGLFRVARTRDGGVLPDCLRHLRFSMRQGGEQFQRAPGTPPRSLKKQFQGVGVPVWERTGPLVWSRDQLVFVPGLGLDARVLAAPGTRQLSLRWVPDPSG